MAESKRSTFEVGEVCYLGAKSVLILNITAQLGFNKYHVIDIDTGEQAMVHRHELFKSAEVNLRDDSDDDLQIDVKENDAINENENEQPNQRFATTTEEDLNNIESNTKAQTTHNQTKWGVKIFKGEQLIKQIHFFEHYPYYCYIKYHCLGLSAHLKDCV